MVREQIVDAVREWLEEDDWHYEYDAENCVITAGISLRNKLKAGKILIFFAEDCYTVYLIAPINGDTENLSELNKYLAMANYGLRNGNFELDVRDGEIRYKVFVNCDGMETIPTPVIRDSVYVGVAMMSRYGDGIAALAFGFSDAETEIQKSEGECDAAEDSDDSDGSEE